MEPAMPPSKRSLHHAKRLAKVVALMLLLGPPVLLLVFRFVPVPITSLMLIRLAQGYPLHHEWVAYRRIAPALPRAVIASEDNLFCSEPLGIDTAALWDQVADWLHGRRPRGASTITMQLARNLFLWPGHSMLRKVLELWLTPQLAILWPKRRILDVYLNSVEFGPGIFGAEAAARHWFGRDAAAPASARWSTARVRTRPDGGRINDSLRFGAYPSRVVPDQWPGPACSWISARRSDPAARSLPQRCVRRAIARAVLIWRSEQWRTVR